jgi:hypothetical protein
MVSVQLAALQTFCGQLEDSHWGPMVQARPVPQSPHASVPQSTSLSPPLRTPSAQDGAAQS